MNCALNSPIGLVAGNGILPRECVAAARAKGLSVVGVLHRGETAPDLADELSAAIWVRVGELNRAIRFFKKQGVGQVVFAGGISRLRLFGGVRPDLRAVRLLARVRSVQDDKLLRAIGAEYEQEGFSVIGVHELLPECLPRPGVLSSRRLSESERSDAILGWQASQALGALDIGQSVAVRGGVVVAVEAVEGTDAMIKRAGALAGAGVVIVKRCKPQQDLRFDLPTIGQHTIETMRQAGAMGLVIEAERTVVLEPAEIVTAANRAGIAIEVWSGAEGAKRTP